MPTFWFLLALNSIPLPPNAADCTALCWQVSPQICVTEQQPQNCTTQLQLHWRSNTPLSPCIYLAEQQLHCWQSSTQGQWQQQLQWQNAVLTLRDSDNKVLLQTELKVQSRKPARRRLSSPWSIF